MNNQVSRLKVLSAFAAVYLAWGSTFIAIRFAVESIPPFLMAGSRFLIAGALLYVFARLRGALVPSLKQWIPATIIGTLLLVCGNGGVALAEKTVPSSLVSLLIAMVPVYFALLEWARPGGSPPGLRVGAGLLIGVLGFLMLVGPSHLFGTAAAIDMRGVVYVLAGSLCWSIGSLYSRGLKIADSPVMGIAMQTLAAGVLMLLISLGLNETARVDLAAIPLKAIFSVWYLIVFGSLVGYSAYIWLLQNVKSSLVATYAYVNPVVAVFLGWALAGEQLSLQTMLSAAVILSAVWIITQAGPSGVQPKKLSEVKMVGAASSKG